MKLEQNNQNQQFLNKRRKKIAQQLNKLNPNTKLNSKNLENQHFKNQA